MENAHIMLLYTTYSKNLSNPGVKKFSNFLWTIKGTRNTQWLLTAVTLSVHLKQNCSHLHG